MPVCIHIHFRIIFYIVSICQLSLNRLHCSDFTIIKRRMSSLLFLVKWKEWIKGTMLHEKMSFHTGSCAPCLWQPLGRRQLNSLESVSFGISIIHERDASDFTKCEESCFYYLSFSKVKSEESNCLKPVLEQYPICNSY